MAEAPRYDIRKFLPSGEGRQLGLPGVVQPGDGYASEDPYALLAVVRLGTPASFDRSTMSSVSVNPRDGVTPPKGDPILIHHDVAHVSCTRSKRSHVKTATVSVRGAARKIVRDIRPGDWGVLWLVPSRARFDDLLERAKTGKPCNRPEDGLRLIGRIHQPRKRGGVSPETGAKEVVYTIQLVGFGEFDTQLFYDHAVATNDLLQASVGRWLTRIGVDASAWFGRHAEDDRKDNVNTILPEILELVLGRGVSKDINAGASAGLSAAAGAGAGEDAPNAYVVPSQVGRLLGRGAGGVLAYADLLAPFLGVEHYEARPNDLKAMTPTSAGPLLGSFLPMFPQMVNTPFWTVLSRYLNPAVNEMFTALRVQSDGTVAPSWVVRQIPFTTDAFDESNVGNVTRFRSLPRWVIPSSLVLNYDVGRSDTTRCNLVHVYGSANDFANNMSVSRQMVEAPPIRDDLDIQRSGPRPLMMTVECAPEDQRGAARKFMELVADRSMGSHLTLNGTFECLGIPGPMPEGDNAEIDGIVYHVEGINDDYVCAPDGKKRWRTVLQLDNGVRAEGDSSLGYLGIDDEGTAGDGTDPAQGGR